jgi:hypothetical protein
VPEHAVTLTKAAQEGVDEPAEGRLRVATDSPLEPPGHRQAVGRRGARTGRYRSQRALHVRQHHRQEQVGVPADVVHRKARPERRAARQPARAA